MADITEMVYRVLTDLQKIGGIEACAVISRDGLLIRGILQKEQFAESIDAMSATMLGAAETATIEFEKGIPQRVIVETTNGRLIAAGAGSKALLVVIVDSNAGLGLILLELDEAAKKLKELLA